MELLVEALSVLHPDVDGTTEELCPRLVIRRGNEMGRKVAKWLPAVLISTQSTCSQLGHTHACTGIGSNTLHLFLLLQTLLLFLHRMHHLYVGTAEIQYITIPASAEDNINVSRQSVHCLYHSGVKNLKGEINKYSYKSKEGCWSVAQLVSQPRPVKLHFISFVSFVSILTERTPLALQISLSCGF